MRCEDPVVVVICRGAAISTATVGKHSSAVLRMDATAAFVLGFHQCMNQQVGPQSDVNLGSSISSSDTVDEPSSEEVDDWQILR